MVYEIEKRSLFTSKRDFDQCRRYIARHGEFVGKFVFKSFLFREPDYLRIRIVKGKPDAVITKKTGSYDTPTRVETEQLVKLVELKPFIAGLKFAGFRECVCVKTESFAYKLDGVRVDFNSMTYLGRIVEVEAMTKDKSQVSLLEAKVAETMDRIGLRELDSKTYQMMMNAMYARGLRPVSRHTFRI